MDDLIAYLASSTTVGQKATLTVLRNGSQKNIDVTLEARPAQQPLTVQQQSPSNPLPQNPGQGNQNPGQGNQNQGNASGSVYLGIAGISVNSDIAQAMNLQTDQAGVLVEQVQQGSPAEKAGLQASDKPVTINGQSVLVGGDIITAVNGQAIASVEELRSILQQSKAGQQVELSILRNGQQTTVNATLAERPN
jgi:2-alkenal reductase